MSDCFGSVGVEWGAEGHVTKACEKLLGEMDTHGVCMHVNSHQIVHFTYVWFIVCLLYLSQTLINSWCHELLVWQGGENTGFHEAVPKWAQTFGMPAGLQ